MTGKIPARLYRDAEGDIVLSFKIEIHNLKSELCEVLADNEAMRFRLRAAQNIEASSYERGVRDAAAEAKALQDIWAKSVHKQRGDIACAEAIHTAILYLLQDNKEKNNE